MSSREPIPQRGGYDRQSGPSYERHRSRSPRRSDRYDDRSRDRPRDDRYDRDRYDGGDRNYRRRDEAGPARSERDRRDRYERTGDSRQLDRDPRDVRDRRYETERNGRDDRDHRSRDDDYRRDAPRHSGRDRRSPSSERRRRDEEGGREAFVRRGEDDRSRGPSMDVRSEASDARSLPPGRRAPVPTGEIRFAETRREDRDTRDGHDRPQNGAPEANGADDDKTEVVEEDAGDIAAMMGFGGFGTTKGKSTGQNADGAVNVNRQRTWRQYMNRPGGFNRPLDKMK